MTQNIPKGAAPAVLPPFRAWLASNIPAVYDNTMSYYDELTTLIEYLETVILPALNEDSEAVTTLSNLYKQLKSYVENYFENLDVQEEINHKLDEMAEDGTLAEIISLYLNSVALFTYDTVSDMKNATNFVNGSFAKTLGFYSKGDFGGSVYKIRTMNNDDVVDESTIIEITGDPTNTLIAELIPESKMNLLQFGITPSDNVDKRVLIQKAIDLAQELVFANKATYYITGPLLLNSGNKLDLNGSTLKSSYKHGIYNFKQTDEFTTYNGNGNIEIKNGKLEGGSISLIHAENVILKNLTFSVYNDHCIELCACKNVDINNCEFYGNSRSDTAGNSYTCINLDPAISNAFPWLEETNPTYDSTPCKNIYISKCIMQAQTNVASGKTNIRGIDVHYTDTVLVNRHSDIFITDNKIHTEGYFGEHILQCNNVVFSNNILESTRYGMTIWGDNINITNNKLIHVGNTSQSSGVCVLRHSVTNASIINNNNPYRGSSGKVKLLSLYDQDMPTELSFAALDYMMVSVAERTSGTNFSLSNDIPFTIFDTIFIGVGSAGAGLYTYTTTSYWEHNIESGNVFKFTCKDGIVSVTFNNDGTVTYNSTTTETTNLRWLALGKGKILS